MLPMDHHGRIEFAFAELEFFLIEFAHACLLPVVHRAGSSGLFDSNAEKEELSTSREADLLIFL